MGREGAMLSMEEENRKLREEVARLRAQTAKVCSAINPMPAPQSLCLQWIHSLVALWTPNEPQRRVERPSVDREPVWSFSMHLS